MPTVPHRCARRPAAIVLLFPALLAAAGCARQGERRPVYTSYDVGYVQAFLVPAGASPACERAATDAREQCQSFRTAQYPRDQRCNAAEWEYSRRCVTAPSSSVPTQR